MGCRLSSGVKLAEAQQKEALIVYQQTIQQAFREVSDALVAYRKNREFLQQQELLAGSTRDALTLSEQRYRGGAASYLEVLDSNTRTFAAELGLAQAQLNELLALVQLYNALGGGWQAAGGTGSQADAPAAVHPSGMPSTSTGPSCSCRGFLPSKSM